ncbi:peptide methionine sulfoxide reductase A2-1-like [Panicum miliaceum]|uniref:peptide-methionine (S)-S-oxide reductase n=1 Tax=Panicum miliaceum TaxID=4540 RepID=A0A3L6QDE6_PANMI|nr:peptide methionine sulfoxide reductase A2-1-like [Panicum miliaceum]
MSSSAASNPALEPDADAPAGEGLALAQFAAGCFWSVELTYQRLPGVARTEVGYSQGHLHAPTYELVCAHGTGHAEVVRLHYDPAACPYAKLLDAFWAKIDPTTLNRQVRCVNQLQVYCRCRAWMDTLNDHLHHLDAACTAAASGQGRRDAVPDGDLLLHGGAGEAGARVAGGAAGQVGGRDRHRDPAGEAVLPRRGVPPALPREGRPVRRQGLHRPHALLRLAEAAARRLCMHFTCQCKIMRSKIPRWVLCTSENKRKCL